MTGIAAVRGERAARVAWARLAEHGDTGVAARICAVGAEEALHSVGVGTSLGERMAEAVSAAVARSRELGG